MAEIDSLQEVVVHCHICMEAFTSEDLFRQHLDHHAVERPHACRICSVRFISKEHLEKHAAKRHAKDALYEACHVCGKLFHDKYNLRSHMAVHSDDRPFACNVCNKSFKRKGELDSHSVTHSSTKPYKCTICKKGFTQKYNLKTHMRMHTGEKPFKCTKCGKEFNRISTVRIHMRTHTNEKPYQCSKCDKNFKFLRDRKKHMLKEHGPARVNVQSKGVGLIKLSVKSLQQQVAKRIALRSGLDLKGKDVLAVDGKRGSLKGDGLDIKGKYECAICREEFTSVTEFNDHIKTHVVDTCFLCGQKLKSKMEKRRHVTRPVTMEESECFTCGLKFNKLEEFKAHLAGHSVLCRLEECLKNAENLHKMSKRFSESKQKEDENGIIITENDDLRLLLEDSDESDDVTLDDSNDFLLQNAQQKTGSMKNATKCYEAAMQEEAINADDEDKHPDTTILELEAISDGRHNNLRVFNVTSSDFRSVQILSPEKEKVEGDFNITLESQKRKRSVFKVGSVSPPRTRRFMKLKSTSIEKDVMSNRVSSKSDYSNIETSLNEDHSNTFSEPQDKKNSVSKVGSTSPPRTRRSQKSKRKLDDEGLETDRRSQFIETVLDKNNGSQSIEKFLESDRENQFIENSLERKRGSEFIENGLESNMERKSIEESLENNRASSESNNYNIEHSLSVKNEDIDDCDLAESYSIYVRNMLRLQPVEKQMALIKSINSAIAEFISD